MPPLGLPLTSRPMSTHEVRMLQLRVIGQQDTTNVKISPYYWGGLNEENLLASVTDYPIHSINVRMPQEGSQMFYQDSLLILLEREYQFFLQKEKEFFRAASELSGYTTALTYPNNVDDSSNKSYLEQTKTFFSKFLDNGEYNIIETMMVNQQLIYGQVQGLYKKQYIQTYGTNADKQSENLAQTQEKITDAQMKRIFKVGKNGNLIFRNKNAIFDIIRPTVSKDIFENEQFRKELMEMISGSFSNLKNSIGVGSARRADFTYTSKQIKEFSNWMRNVLFPSVIKDVKQLFPSEIVTVEGSINDAGFSLTAAFGLQSVAATTQKNNQDEHTYAQALIKTFKDTIQTFLNLDGQVVWNTQKVQKKVEEKIYEWCTDDSGIISLFERAEPTQIKGMVGECAAGLLSILFPNKKSQQLIKSLIVGNIKDKSGESIAVDVLLKMGQSIYGIQVKRYSDNTINKSKTNDVSLEIKNTSALERYLGLPDVEFLQFLEVNQGFFAETTTETGLTLDSIEEIEYNTLYAHYPDFMRLQQQNLENEVSQDINKARSNFYLIQTMLIPSSYFIHAIYKEIVACYKKADLTHIFNIEQNSLKTPTKQSNPKSIPVEDAIKKATNRIIFKGITLGKIL